MLSLTEATCKASNFRWGESQGVPFGVPFGGPGALLHGQEHTLRAWNLVVWISHVYFKDFYISWLHEWMTFVMFCSVFHALFFVHTCITPLSTVYYTYQHLPFSRTASFSGSENANTFLQNGFILWIWKRTFNSRTGTVWQMRTGEINDQIYGLAHMIFIC